MKIKNYEKLTYIYTVIFILFILMTILIFYSFNNNIKTYNTINSNVIKDDLVEVLVTDKELKTIYSNKYLYLNRKRRKIKIEEVNRKVLVRKHKNYHNVLLKIKLGSNAKVNDIKTLTLFNKRINIFEMIRIIWKGV